MPPSSPRKLKIYSDPESSPEVLQCPRERDWLYLEPMLKKTFGWGELQPELSWRYVRRGPNGLDGLHQFLHYFIERRGLTAECIRVYIHVLLKAIELRWVPSFAWR
ncbi:hypothetical protein DFH08DRAFT_806125 [Mycena albidolilacea]|uniref:Uncharacterized protein n=1 Tax=Mycena albidolilacea TaxID=1033008 RepID=A0AAD7A8L0_9AGAR|nr:hypothetical protein DFH08DRAFT_806125 [Mycena albidolilacea]